MSEAAVQTEQVQSFRETFAAIEQAVGRVIVGQEDVLRKILTAFFSNGHVLIEGVPGLGKTRIVRCTSDALALGFRRIQFTPDLMPSDIVGAQILTEDGGTREFRFRRGPIFANVVLADEINRATPKTQSAVLEAMEERQVTSFGETHRLDEPFFLLATQNPIELEGTYPLPEAQLDRFLFKVVVRSPSAGELKEILRRTTAGPSAEVEPAVEAVRLGEMKRLVRDVVLAPPLEDAVVGIVAALTPGDPAAVPAAKDYVRLGPSPRGAQAMVLGAKVNALLDGRGNVSHEDLTDVVLPALRHRLILNFQAEAEGVTTESVIAEAAGKASRRS